MKWEEMPIDSRRALEMVGSKLYKEPPHITLIHEVIGNANDEFNKGLTKNPEITIDFQEYVDGEFVGLIIFRNNAPPIPEEFFKEKYHKMFTSSKSTEGDGIGFVGIGAKQFLQSKSNRQIITITGNDKSSLLASIWMWPEEGNPQIVKTPQESYTNIIGSRKISHEEGTSFIVNLTKNEYDDLKLNIVHYIHKWWNYALLKNKIKLIVSKEEIQPWIPSIEKPYTDDITISGKKIDLMFWTSDEELKDGDEDFPNILYVVGDKMITSKRIEDKYKIKGNFAKRIFCYADTTPILKSYVTMSKEDFMDGYPFVHKIKKRIVQKFWDYIRKKGLLKENLSEKTRDMEMEMILNKLNELLQSKEFKKWNPFLKNLNRRVPVVQPSGDESLSESMGFQQTGENSINENSEGVLGPNEGSGNVLDKKGNGKGELKLRKSLGIDIGYIDAPEKKEEAWIDDESKSLVINLGHDFFNKIDTEARRSGFTSLREFNKKRIIVDALVRYRMEIKDGSPQEIFEDSIEFLQRLY